MKKQRTNEKEEKKKAKEKEKEANKEKEQAKEKDKKQVKESGKGKQENNKNTSDTSNNSKKETKEKEKTQTKAETGTSAPPTTDDKKKNDNLESKVEEIGNSNDVIVKTNSLDAMLMRQPSSIRDKLVGIISLNKDALTVKDVEKDKLLNELWMEYATDRILFLNLKLPKIMYNKEYTYYKRNENISLSRFRFTWHKLEQLNNNVDIAKQLTFSKAKKLIVNLQSKYNNYNENTLKGCKFLVIWNGIYELLFETSFDLFSLTLQNVHSGRFTTKGAISYVYGQFESRLIEKMTKMAHRTYQVSTMNTKRAPLNKTILIDTYFGGNNNCFKWVVSECTKFVAKRLEVEHYGQAGSARFVLKFESIAQTLAFDTVLRLSSLVLLSLSCLAAAPGNKDEHGKKENAVYVEGWINSSEKRRYLESMNEFSKLMIDFGIYNVCFPTQPAEEESFYISQFLFWKDHCFDMKTIQNMQFHRKGTLLMASTQQQMLFYCKLLVNHGFDINLKHRTYQNTSDFYAQGAIREYFDAVKVKFCLVFCCILWLLPDLIKEPKYPKQNETHDII